MIAEPSFTDMRDVEFEVDPRSSLSLIESLICIGISHQRSATLKYATIALKELLKDDGTWLTKNLQRDADCFSAMTKLLVQTAGESAGETSPPDRLTTKRFSI